jgi:hypothetical protein
MKYLCVIIIIVCVCLAIFSIVNSIRTARRNKATDEVSQKICLADVEREVNAIKEKKGVSNNFNAVNVFEPVNKPLDYNTYEEEEIQEETQGKSLKDFFA